MAGMIRTKLRIIPVGAFLCLCAAFTHAKPYESVLPPSSVSQLEQVVMITPDNGASIYGLGWTSIVGAFITLVLVIYMIRHLFFTYNRLFAKQRHPYLDIDEADWPSVTVFIAAHNEEAVIANALGALLETDYPVDKIKLVPVNDRSTDRTREIINQFVERYPGRIFPFHRTSGKPGKAAALKDATATVDSELLIIFDADYIPAKALIKRLVSAFFDPETGAVMGRVVPLNVGSNLLTRLLDLERSGGYQVDQQARMNLHLVPQYGGTVGGVRMQALNAIGGWHDDVLAEDTDLTYRLLLSGWKTVYQNRCECYEEVPEAWPVRVRQIKRWAKGHNQALFRHIIPLIRESSLPWRERLDGVLLLGVYVVPMLVMIGWFVSIIAIYTSQTPLASGLLWTLGFISYCGLGNFSAFFEVGAAVYLDYRKNRIRLLPFTFFGFIVSMVGISKALLDQLFLDKLLGKKFHWDKTVRYQAAKHHKKLS